jgi:Flp pilus assembly protein TadB
MSRDQHLVGWAFNLAVVLTAFGGALPVAAFAMAWRQTRRRAATIDHRIKRAIEITQRPEAEKLIRGQSDRELYDAEGIAWSTFADVLVIRLLIERYVVGDQLPSFKFPAIVGGVGVACGTAATVMSLWA